MTRADDSSRSFPKVQTKVMKQIMLLQMESTTWQVLSHVQCNYLIVEATQWLKNHGQGSTRAHEIEKRKHCEKCLPLGDDLFSVDPYLQKGFSFVTTA